jgi:hypothetical protein
MVSSQRYVYQMSHTGRMSLSIRRPVTMEDVHVLTVRMTVYCTPLFVDRVIILKHLKLKAKPVPLHTMEALGGRGAIAPTHSCPRH